MNLKPNTYYKCYYVHDLHEYDIMYIDNEWVYFIADMRINEPIYKYDKKYKWGTIREWQAYINRYNVKVEELSKEDVFLELL